MMNGHSVLPTVVGSGQADHHSEHRDYLSTMNAVAFSRLFYTKSICWSSVDQWLGLLLCAVMVLSSNPQSLVSFFFFATTTSSTLGRTLGQQGN